jgi:outer membrane protein W
MRPSFFLVVVLSTRALAQEVPALEPRDTGLFFRVGALVLVPVAHSSEVSLANVDGAARLAVSDGPIPGSSAALGTAFIPAAMVGWSLPFLERRLSIETVLALPFTLKLFAGGTLANQSLAPVVLGNLRTGLPALGPELGEARVLPPVLTATWRFGPFWRVKPYLGLGVSYLMTLDARITNPVLTEVATPTLQIPPRAGLVLQGGADLHVWRWFFVTLDVKYIAGLDLEARVSNIWVRLPNLPLYDAVRVGDTTVKVTVNPVVFQLGLGLDL